MIRSGLRLGFLWFCLIPGLKAFASQSDVLVGSLTLSRALELALSHSPDLAAARHDVVIRAGLVLQARLPGNPELGFEAENLEATGALRDADRELTTRVSQTVDLGIFSRASVAARELESARLELQGVQSQVRTRVRQQFVSMQAAQERLGLSRELVQLAGTALGLAVEKVRAGKAPPTDSLQAFVAFSLARIDSGRAEEVLSQVRRALASACGLAEASFDSVQGRLGPVIPVPEWKTIESGISGTPDWKRSALEGKVRDAELRAEKTARIPPLTLEAGFRHVAGKEGHTLVAGVSLPLPLWNWNQGAIRSARSRKAKSEEEGKAQRIDIRERLAGLHGRAASSYREASLLESQVLPAAGATFEGAREAYRVGKFGSLDVLNAQRSLFEVRARHLDALTEYHLAMSGLAEMLGNPVGASDPGPDTK
ncbi:MAG: TolC family protein [Fibrobacterota bacterium]|nr:TolC family protein [Fibrobacterota bacterium]